jgi:transposase
MKKTNDFDSWLKIFMTLDESRKRWFAAQKASELGYGGIKKISDITGLSGTAITKGMKELGSGKPLNTGNVRKTGGGRNSMRKADRDAVREIDRILEETTAGDPMSSLKWTCKSVRNIADELNSKGFKISYRTVCRILNDSGYSLQANRKVLSGSGNPDRDAQFQYINCMVRQYIEDGSPVISADTKKKELAGNFKNNGRIWRKKGNAGKVNDHDFCSMAEGIAIPYGTYDIHRNEGFVNVGITSDTAEFAVRSIRQWWEVMGRKRYPDSEKLLICADGGGSNGSRNRAWKYNLQKFSDRSGLSITVCHYPPGTSKWNKIEHRMFSFISLNWKGKPLESYETAVNLIGGTKNRKGLKIEARLDENEYRKGVRISDEEFSRINIRFHEKHPRWNYTIIPDC